MAQKLMNTLWALAAMLVFFGSTAGAETLSIPLHKLTPAKTVDLLCTESEYNVKIPVPERWRVKEASLDFTFVNSSALLGDMSRLIVKVNGKPLKQVRLNPLRPKGHAKVYIPASLLDPGYNDLTFEVIQHYSMGCDEEPCRNVLWTTLNLDEAIFRIEYSLRPVPLTLDSVVDFLFDPKIYPHGEVNVVTEDTSPGLLTAAGIVASGIAEKFDYQKVFFSVSDEIRPGLDNVLVGSGEFVERFLKSRGVEIEPITEPFLKVVQLPLNTPKEALLIISGKDADQVKLAAETLAVMTIGYSGIDEMVSLDLTLPEIPLYEGRLVLKADKEYALKTLNMDTHTFTFKDLQPDMRDLVFRLPVDFLIKQNRYAKLTLNFSYGARMRADSVLNILINGKKVRAIPLDDPNGAMIEGYSINMPTYMFKPGVNTMRFESALSPSESGEECEYLQTENLFLTLYDNSTFYFPPMSHFVELPRIELFMLNGFPFTRWPDGRETTMYLTRSGPDTFAAALNLVGLITTLNGYPLLELNITLERPVDPDGEVIVVGDIKSIPTDLKAAAPLKLDPQSLVAYPVARGWKEEVSLVMSSQISGLGPKRGLVMEFQSPEKKGRTVLMLTAASPGDLHSLSRALLEPAVQAESKGDMVLVYLTPPDYEVVALEIGKKYYTSKGGKISKLKSYLHTSPYLYYIALGSLIVFLGLVTFYVLRRLRRRRLQHED